MCLFRKKFESFLVEFTRGKTMVLSSSLNDKVSSRMMSIVCIDGVFYFQTDKTFRKYNQLIQNPQVALCTENIQIEGICTEIGHPLEDSKFCNIYKECFGDSFIKYSSLKNERLFVVTPTYVEKWTYINKIPFLETFDVPRQEYTLTKYEGV